MLNAFLVLFCIVSNCLSTLLGLQQLPVNFDMLAKDHVHAKSQVTWIVWTVQRNSCADGPGAGLNKMIDVVIPIVNGMDGNAKVVTKSEMEKFNEGLCCGALHHCGFTFDIIAAKYYLFNL